MARPCFLTTTPSALSPLPTTSLFFLFSFLTHNSWWLITGRGLFHPWGFSQLALPRKGSSQSPSLQLALRPQSLLAVRSPALPFSLRLPQSSGLGGSTPFCHCECSPPPGPSGLSPSSAWLHTAPLMPGEPEWQVAAWCWRPLHRWAHMPHSGKDPPGHSSWTEKCIHLESMWGSENRLDWLKFKSQPCHWKCIWP